MHTIVVSKKTAITVITFGFWKSVYLVPDSVPNTKYILNLKKKNLLNKRINDALLVLGYLFCYTSGHSAQSRTSHCFHALEASLKHLRLICLLPVGVAGEGGCAVLASEAIQGRESSTHGDVKTPVPSPRMLRSACKCR